MWKELLIKWVVEAVGFVITFGFLAGMILVAFTGGAILN